MLKLVINSPKGGVGKTTIATNAALLLAAEGKKVLVLKLSSSSRILQHIENKQKENPDLYGSIEIADENKFDPEEFQGLPTSFPGMGKFDVAVADTDDKWEILEKLVDKKGKGWRVIAPIVPGDSEAMEAIPDELKIIVTQSQIKGFPLKLTIVPNRCGEKKDVEEDIEMVKNKLQQTGLLGKLSSYYLPYVENMSLPDFLENDDFYTNLKLILSKECEIKI